MEDWKEYKLGDIGTIVGGATPSTKDSSNYDGNIAWITPKDLSNLNCRYISHGERMISQKGFDDCSCRMLPKNSILFSSRAPIGYVAIAQNALCTNQGFKSIIPNNEIVDSLFLYYLLVYYKPVIENMGSGTTFKEVSGSVMKALTVNIPNIDKQKRIAAILSSLDDKIELNSRINGNLEQQAQALFKAWFVDFEPFKNGKFIDSELGKIPEGWKVGQLDELVEIKYGKDHKKLLPGNIPVYGSGGIMRHVNMPIYEKESVLIPRKGSLNNVLYVNHPFWTVDTMFYTRMKINGIAKFIYLFISPIDLLSMNNGSAVPSMTTEILSKIRLVIPSKNIFDNFESLVAPFFDKIGSCNKEICKLSNLRDALLPKLLSGELSINTITE